MTSKEKEVFEALKKELSETDIIPVEDNFVFEPVDETELEKYYRYLIVADEAYCMDPKRSAPRASYFCGEVWTLSDECGNFVAVAHVVAHVDRSRNVWVWKGEVMYLHN